MHLSQYQSGLNHPYLLLRSLRSSPSWSPTSIHSCPPPIYCTFSSQCDTDPKNSQFMSSSVPKPPSGSHLTQSQSQGSFDDLQGPTQHGAPSPIILRLAALLQLLCFSCCFLHLLSSLLPQRLCTSCFFCLDSFPPNNDMGHSLSFFRSLLTYQLLIEAFSDHPFKKLHPLCPLFFPMSLFTICHWLSPPPTSH